MVAGGVRLDAEQPWPGLEAYPEAGRAFFHGRDEEIERLLGLVDAHPLVLLFGESGLGKTSLLQAGVFPRLRERLVLPVLVRMDHARGAAPLGDQVLAALAEALDAAGIDGPRPTAGDRLWEYAHRADTLLWSPTQELVQPLLVFDQFEELFTLGGGLARPSVSDFVDELGELVLDRPPERAAGGLEAYDRARPAPHVLLSFREEFLAEVEELLPQFGPQLQRRLRLGPLSVERAADAVERAGGALVSAAVAADIAASVSGGRATVEPSLLSVYCRELNARRLEVGAAAITSALVREVGATVLPAFYARSVDDAPPAVLEFVEERLLTEGGRRNIVTLEEALAVPGVTRTALEQLVSRRIIRIEERFGAERVELTHDVLAPIVGEARKVRRAAAAEHRLAEELEAQRAETARVDGERRRWRRLTAASVTLAVVALGSMLAAVVLMVRAQRAENEQLRLSADAMLTGMRLSKTLRDSIGHLAAAVETGPEPEAASVGLLLALRNFASPLVTIHSHPGRVTDAVFSADGRSVITASTRSVTSLSTGAVQTWDVRTGMSMSPPLLFKNVWSVSLDPTGERVAKVSLQGTWQVWDSRRRMPLTDSLLSSPTHRLEFSPDGRRIFAATRSGGSQVWEVHESASRGLVLNDSVTAISPDGRWIVTVSELFGARVWDAQTGAQSGPALPQPTIDWKDVLKTGYVPPAGRVTTASFSPDGERVAIVSEDFTATVWNVRTGERVGVPLRHSRHVQSVLFSPDGALLLTVVWDSAYVWDLRTQRASWPIGHRSRITSAEFSRNSTLVVTASQDGTARLWDARTGYAFGPPLPHPEAVSSARFSPDDNRVVTVSADGVARVWDARTEELSGSLLSDDVDWGRVPAFKLDLEGASLLSRGGVQLAILWNGKVAQVWDLRRNEAVGPPLQHLGEVTSASFSPDGTTLVTASEDDSARVWDVRSGVRIGVPMPHEDDVESAMFSPDGRRVVTASDDYTARVWDARTGQPLSKPMEHSGGVNFAAFSPDGERVVTASDDSTARMWNASSGAQVGPPMKHQNAVARALLSPDGSRLVTAEAHPNGPTRVWDTGTGASVGLLRHRDGAAAHSPAISQDGTRILTIGGIDGAQAFDVRTGASLGESASEGSVEAAAFTHDDVRVVVLNSDDVKFWDTRTVDRSHRAELVNLATAIVGGHMRGLLDFVPMPPAEQSRRLAEWRRRAAGWANAPDGSFEQWVHWYFSDPSTRPDQPGLWRSARP